MRCLPLILGIVGGALGAARPCAAQLGATLDAGLSLVRYDGFLASTAASLTPQLRWDGRRTHVSARATYLRFESGNTSREGTVTAAWVAPLGSRWRAEIAASAGASEYAAIASFWHGVAEGRLHFIGGTSGAWIGGTGGRASFGRGAAARPVAAAAIGAWALHSHLTWLASLDRSVVGDTAYSDLRASVRRRSGALSLEASLGARFASRGGGRGIYGEGSAALAISRSVTLVLAGGRYPTDAVSGSIAGRYLTAAVRIGGGGVRPRPLVTTAPRSSTAPRLQPLEREDGLIRLTITAPRAERVEIAGTFTGWQPVTLARRPGGREGGAWEVRLPIAAGIHRMNVRIDGGPWLAPAGTTRVADDYGGEVGILVVR